MTEKVGSYRWRMLALKTVAEWFPKKERAFATGIPEERCRRINLGYLDPASVKIEKWAGREDEDILVVPRAGEMLYRLAG